MNIMSRNLALTLSTVCALNLLPALAQASSSSATLAVGSTVPETLANVDVADSAALKKAGATKLSVKPCDWPPPVAVISAVWFELKDDTVAVKPAVVAPAPTVTPAGTVALALLLDSVTSSPPPGAAAVSVTVHAEVPGAFTAPGAQFTPLTVAPALRLTVAVLVCPL